MVANVGNPGYALELSIVVPSVGLTKATFRFPGGEVSMKRNNWKEKSSISRPH